MPVLRLDVVRPTFLLAACCLAVACSERSQRTDRAVSVSVSGGADSVASATSSVGISVGHGAATGDVASRSADASYGKPTFAEGEEGGVSIHTRNGAMVMSLRHDSVVVAFSDSMRTAIKREMHKSMKEDTATDADEESAIGQVIKGVVKSTVSGALNEVFEKSRGFPVSVIREVSYESGAIHFEFTKKPTWNFENFNSDDEPLMEQFHPSDAARFVGAVRARLK